MGLLILGQTCWRRCAASGGLLGLDYTQLHTVAAWAGIQPSRWLLKALATLESDILRLSRESAHA